MVALYFPRGSEAGCCEPDWIWVAVLGIVGLALGALVAHKESD